MMPKPKQVPLLPENVAAYQPLAALARAAVVSPWLEEEQSVQAGGLQCLMLQPENSLGPDAALGLHLSSQAPELAAKGFSLCAKVPSVESSDEIALPRAHRKGPELTKKACIPPTPCSGRTEGSTVGPSPSPEAICPIHSPLISWDKRTASSLAPAGAMTPLPFCGP